MAGSRSSVAPLIKTSFKNHLLAGQTPHERGQHCLTPGKDQSIAHVGGTYPAPFSMQDGAQLVSGVASMLFCIVPRCTTA